LIITSNATTSPHSIALSGSGCVANAEYRINPTPFPTFGNVQRGFRTVRIIRISNEGDGLLTFTARIAGVDANLFGIQLPAGSNTSPVSSQSYAISPSKGCGVASGQAEEDIGITFHANDAPRAVQAQLIIESLNATNVPATITYNLEATITAPSCQDIRNHISDLQNEKAELQKELKDASPAHRRWFISEIKRVTLEIKKANDQLKNCVDIPT
jgi:hypothetical protein